jgi:hypothetical protein
VKSKYIKWLIVCTFGKFQGAARQPQEVALENVDQQSNNFPVEHSETSVTPLVTTSTVTVFHSESSFVYNNGFVLASKDGRHCGQCDISVTSATVFYNLALSYHRLAVSTPESPCRWGWIRKATTFYQQAIDLISLLDIRSTGHNDTTFVALASYNNLGQIHFEFLSDHDTARRCLESFSYIMQLCNPSVESEEGSLFSKEDWNGFKSNLFFIYVLVAKVAAAA